ncbi:PilZ domain-containing protein [Paractinoplanes hotanensis]|uniref:PilZ domain-containing protein n=1 Tax=Paractinoplanes hotanensis TaxID=2906497 RepID=A0ABT0Y1P0_9ACTN|nr:PilZ domain-containing protein [Actinoplanes hotanensis]MCM4079943.1 PilZ domain-containing protein [Actinoplanes hotanensis]
MSTPMLPADGSYIELTSYGETLPDVRVVQATAALITLSLALDDLPAADAEVTLRWAAAPRGRYAVAGNVAAVDGNRVRVTLSGEPAIEQSRGYVRGGGGEPIVLILPGQAAAEGTIHDLSEGAVRAHFTDVEVAAGDDITLRMQVGDEIVEFPARAVKVNSVRQQIPRRGPLIVELVAVFTTADEHQARIIRRYIFSQQLKARAAARGS